MHDQIQLFSYSEHAIKIFSFIIKAISIIQVLEALEQTTLILNLLLAQILLNELNIKLIIHFLYGNYGNCYYFLINYLFELDFIFYQLCI
jgi:hypothetical protein